MNEINTKRMLYPFLITLAGVIMMFMMFFLPIASAKGEYREYLIKYDDVMFAEEIDMTNAEAVNMSLMEFLQVYIMAVNLGINTENNIIYTIIIALFAFFVLCAVIMALRKKPIGLIIFDILTISIFRFIQWAFKEDRIVPNKRYDWGIVNILTYVAGVVIIIGAVWLLIEKIKAKKIAKDE